MIKDFQLEENKKPQYIKNFLATYKYKGFPRSWEIIESHDSVAVLIYNKDNNSFVFVKQFRAPVYFSNKCGISIELCAGLVDKDCSYSQIAKEEIEEECGYRVPLDNIEEVSSFISSPGRSGAFQYMFYAEITNDMQVSCGGGIHDEDIEVIEVPLSEIDNFFKNNKFPLTSGMAYMILWWEKNKSGGLNIV